MGEGDLDKLHITIQGLTAENNALVEARMAANERPGDDKLRLFKQQAMLIARKKASTAERVQEVAEELAGVRREYQKAKEQAGDGAGGGLGDGGPRMLKADEFKAFVGRLRTKNTNFKEKRAALAALRQEFLVLSGTQEQLQDAGRASEAAVARLESKHGVSGFGETQNNLEKVRRIGGNPCCYQCTYMHARTCASTTFRCSYARWYALQV